MARRRPETTRRRIVEATVALHEEIGPAATTISAIAERAGVQRLTVYRHFPDEAAMVGACSARWGEDHPLPDPAEWAGIADPAARLSAALEALYGYYRAGEAMLDRVLRDESRVPSLGPIVEGWRQALRDVALGLSAGWGAAADGQRLVHAAVEHAIHFETWRSLASGSLTEAEAVALMTRFVSAIARSAPL